MKLLSSITMVLVLGLAACGAKKDGGAATGSGSGSGTAVVVVDTGSGSGSAASMSGSGSGAAMAAGSGSGSAMAAGSGSAAAMAGSGSGSAMAADAGSGSGSATMAAGSGSAAAMAGSGSGSADPNDMAFDHLTHDDKVKLMKEHVTPDMKKAFQDYDAKKFAGFNCKTCHGKDPAKAKFKMPNPELPKLDFEALKAGKQNPKMAKFMDDVVEPKMVEELGAKKFDMTTMTGFGCLGCHVQKK